MVSSCWHRGIVWCRCVLALQVERISSGSDSAQTSATNVVSGAAALGIDAVCEVRRVGLNQRIAHGATSVAAELDQE